MVGVVTAVLSGPKRYEEFSPEEKRLTALVLLIMEDTIDNECLRHAFGIDTPKASTLIKSLSEENVIVPVSASRKFAKYRLSENFRQKVFG